MKTKYLLLLALFGCEAGPSAEEEATKPKQVHVRCKLKFKQHCTEAITTECPNGYTILEEGKEVAEAVNFETYKIIAECK